MALTQRHKNAQKIHTRPHSRMLLGRVVHEGYSSRYLVAHNCTTSGFHSAFLFRGLWVAPRTQTISAYLFHHAK